MDAELHFLTGAQALLGPFSVRGLREKVKAPGARTRSMHWGCPRPDAFGWNAAPCGLTLRNGASCRCPAASVPLAVPRDFPRPAAPEKRVKSRIWQLFLTPAAESHRPGPKPRSDTTATARVLSIAALDRSVVAMGLLSRKRYLRANEMHCGIFLCWGGFWGEPCGRAVRKGKFRSRCDGLSALWMDRSVHLVFCGCEGVRGRLRRFLPTRPGETGHQMVTCRAGHIAYTTCAHPVHTDAASGDSAGSQCPVDRPKRRTHGCGSPGREDRAARIGPR